MGPGSKLCPLVFSQDNPWPCRSHWRKGFQLASPQEVKLRCRESPILMVLKDPDSSEVHPSFENAADNGRYTVFGRRLVHENVACIF